MENPEISVILPTYNEGENIVPLIERIFKCVRHKTEIIVVDDNSPDGTAQKVTANFNNNPAVRLIVRTEEKGLTSAIQRGIDTAKGKLLVWLDCDLSTPPEVIPVMAETLADPGYDFTVASRYVEGGSDDRTDSHKAILFVHKHFSRIITVFTSLMLWPAFKDWTSGYIMVRSTLMQDIRLRGDYGEYFIELVYTLLKKGYKVKEVPYHLIPRERGTSKTATNIFGFFKRGIKYVARVFSLRFFGIPRQKGKSS